MMKKALSFLPLLLVVACGGDPAAPPNTGANPPPGTTTPTSSTTGVAPAAGPKVFPQTAKSIDVKVGETFNVVLPGNVTTPFEWRYDDNPNPSVSMSGHNYTDAPPANCQGCDGYKGTFNFTFAAKTEGTTKLHFSYARATPPGSPMEKEFAVDVHVTK